MSDEETNKLVEAWEYTTRELNNLKKEVNKTECSLKNAENALGKHLSPKDHKVEETIYIWVNGRLLGSKRTNEGSDFELSWRK